MRFLLLVLCNIISGIEQKIRTNPLSQGVFEVSTCSSLAVFVDYVQYLEFGSIPVQLVTDQMCFVRLCFDKLVMWLSC